MADRRDAARLAPADIERAHQWIREARDLLAGLEDPVARDQLGRLLVAEAFLRQAEAANRQGRLSDSPATAPPSELPRRRTRDAVRGAEPGRQPVRQPIR